MSTFGNNNVQMFGNYTTRRMSNYGPRSNGMQMNNEMMFGRVSQQDARDMMMWQSMKPPEPSTFEKIMAVALPLLSIAGTIFAAIAGSRASTPAETTETTEQPATTATEAPVTDTTEAPVTDTTEAPVTDTTEAPLSEGDPGNETANKLKDLLADGSEKCTIEGGKTGICKADTYEGKIILPDGQVIEDGKFPQELRMTLPAGYKGTMKLTLIDAKKGIYESSAKDRNFQVVINDDGSVTMKAITNDEIDALLKQHQARYGKTEVVPEGQDGKPTKIQQKTVNFNKTVHTVGHAIKEEVKSELKDQPRMYKAASTVYHNVVKPAAKWQLAKFNAFMFALDKMINSPE